MLLGAADLLHVPDHLSGQCKARKTKPPHTLSSARGRFQPDRVDSVVKGKVCQRHISSKAQWNKHELQHQVMIVFWWSCTTWLAAAAAAAAAVVAVAAVAAAVVVAAV